MPGPDLFDKAVALQEAGRLGEAEALCRRIIAAEPGRSGPLLLLGVIRAQSGDGAAALPLIERALGLDPDVALGHFWRGMVLSGMGRVGDALKSYQRAVQINPHFMEAYYNAGHLLLAVNHPNEALAAFERTLALQPDAVEAQCARAGALSRLHRNGEALAQLDTVIAAHPTFVAGLTMRSELHCELGRHDEALADTERALALDPNQSAVYASRGRILAALQRPDEARGDFDRALTLDPNAAGALTMRGVLHAEGGRLAEALADCERAATLAPTNAAMHANLGKALAALGRKEAAAEAFSKAIGLDPKAAKAYHNRATVLRHLQRYEEALADCERALELDPAEGAVAGERFLLAGMLCEWRERGARCEDLKQRIREGQAVSAWIAATAIDDPELQLAAARRASRTAVAVAPKTPAHKRLRIAYVCPDFSEHPSAHLIVELIERHDRARFETFAVSLNSGGGGAFAQRIAAAFEHAIDLGGRSDAEAAALLRAQEIDIAVDLAGHSGGGRPGIFAYRPAPLVVNYAGHPGTLGAEWADYIIADGIVAPPENDAYFSERVVRLPDCYLASDTRFEAAPRPERAAAGLPEGGFVFCSFNHGYKLTPEMFDIWMRLLRGADGSVLWLLGENAAMRRNLRAEAQARGVAPERLVFADRLPREEYMARLALADLFLDGLPCNAHTTASDALWVGVPLVTCMGKGFAARVAGSMLTSIGMEELIARDLEHYETLARGLAQSPGRLADVRSRLAANRATHPLFDMARRTRHIESAYQMMWQRQREGLPPAAFAVAPVN